VDRVYLDANILFSAAYKPGSPLRQLWQLADVELITSVQAVLEAYNNLSSARPVQLTDLAQLLQSVTIFPDPLPGFVLPAAINLPDKDKPILQAAIDAQATHLVTGDVKHFGPYYGQTIAGVLILPPAQYLYLHGQQRNP
jgi:predicted nucleic acid-binding protein